MGGSHLQGISCNDTRELTSNFPTQLTQLSAELEQDFSTFLITHRSFKDGQTSYCCDFKCLIAQNLHSHISSFNCLDGCNYVSIARCAVKPERKLLRA